jgi:hypothetical protein
VDERERQRRCRERRREGACHAPPSAPKPAEIKAEVLQSWDRVVALSRATLARRLFPLRVTTWAGAELLQDANGQRTRKIGEALGVHPSHARRIVAAAA